MSNAGSISLLLSPPGRLCSYASATDTDSGRPQAHGAEPHASNSSPPTRPAWAGLLPASGGLTETGRRRLGSERMSRTRTIKSSYFSCAHLCAQPPRHEGESGFFAASRAAICDASLAARERERAGGAGAAGARRAGGGGGR